MRLINLVFQTLKLVAICSAFIFGTGCALQKDRLDDQRISIKEYQSTAIHFNSIHARKTDKGLQIYGSLKTQSSWPKLTRTHINIEVLSADGEILKQANAKVRQKRGRGYRKRFYSFSTLIRGTFPEDVRLNFIFQSTPYAGALNVNGNRLAVYQCRHPHRATRIY